MEEILRFAQDDNMQCRLLRAEPALNNKETCHPEEGPSYLRTSVCDENLRINLSKCVILRSAVCDEGSRLAMKEILRFAQDDNMQCKLLRSG
jgi:hypothetical protein